MKRKVILICCVLSILTCGSEKKPPAATHTIPAEKKETQKETQDSSKQTSVALAPVSAPDYDTSQWAELQASDSFILDLRYASTDNFVKEQMYDCPRCFLRPKAAKALLQVQQELAEKGLRIKLFDCYRPRQVQERLWAKVPNASYVTPPKKGSMHNRGMAVDLTLTDAGGKELDMGTEFDFFGPRAHHTYTDLPKQILDNRQLLKSVMARHGFRAIRTEWWHYSYRAQAFPLDSMLWNCDH